MLNSNVFLVYGILHPRCTHSGRKVFILKLKLLKALSVIFGKGLYSTTKTFWLDHIPQQQRHNKFSVSALQKLSDLTNQLQLYLKVVERFCNRCGCHAFSSIQVFGFDNLFNVLPINSNEIFFFSILRCYTTQQSMFFVGDFEFAIRKVDLTFGMRKPSKAVSAFSGLHFLGRS